MAKTVSTLSIWDERQAIAITLSCNGWTQAEIAEYMGVSQRQVSTYITRGYEAAREAVERGYDLTREFLPL